MHTAKRTATLFILALACGILGFLWGRSSVPQETGTTLSGEQTDSASNALKSQYTMLQEILVSVKTTQQQVDALSKLQVAMLRRGQAPVAAPTDTDGSVSGPGQPPEQPVAAIPGMPEVSPEKIQEFFKKQQEIQQSPVFQEMRQREKQEMMEWTDSLDPDSPPSDG
jgi:DNA polymerase III psi subunit